MQVVKVTNPAIFLDPGFQDFLKEALAGSLYGKASPEALLPAMVEKVTQNPNAALHLGIEGAEYKGLALTFLPVGPLDFVPRTVLFYLAPGRGKGLKRALIQAVVDFVKENHYTSLWAINGSGARDCVWRRVFRQAGPATKVGSVLEIALG